MEFVEDEVEPDFKFVSEFRGEAGIGTWLYTTVRNACRQLLRPVARRHRLFGDQVEMDALDDVSSDVLGREELAIRAELVSTVQVALERLSHEHRQILILRDIEGVSLATSWSPQANDTWRHVCLRSDTCLHVSARRRLRCGTGRGGNRRYP